MKVRFRKLFNDAVEPTKMHETDAGFDLTAQCVTIEQDLNIITYGTGIAVEIPRGYVGLIFPRSSVYKYQLGLSNCVGVIDSGYRGEIQFKFRSIPPYTSRYTVGERIGQLIIIPYPEIEFEEVEELGVSDRGVGGFGSTDNQ